MVEQKPQPQVVLFSTPTCSWCRKTKQYLSEHRIRCY
ncbi:MAG: glutaredoxin family protein, partial [Deltaproteobacteria bacterium]|nr:glutaredoxin family protein [Deltaproteobacteria bacterium]